MKNIVIVEPKSISVKDKAKLLKLGVTVIEHPNPDKVRIVTPIEEVQGSTMLKCSIAALAEHSCDVQAKNFVKKLSAELNKTNTP